MMAEGGFAPVMMLKTMNLKMYGVGVLMFSGLVAGCGPRSVVVGPDGISPAYRSGSAGGSGSAGAMPQATAQGEAYDFYLLNLSWAPEFCATHQSQRGGSQLECTEHRGFIVHGLWPQNNDGSYPQHCASRPGPTSAGAWSDVMPDTGLVRHEWETHGTCTPYDGDAYFGLIRKAFKAVKIPADFAQTDHEFMLPPTGILGEFAKANPSFPAGSLALSCGNNRLTALEVCLGKDLQPIACSNVRSCRANAVKVTPQR